MITCVAIPDFASFDFPEVKNGDKVLDPSKYESIDNDISSATGVSNALTNATNSNYASAKLNLEIIYEKIGILLEQVEEIYNQLIEIILGERGQNYLFSYVKGMPLSKKEILTSLEKLQSNGYATKYVLDILGIDSEEFYEESIYEIETLKLRERIIPPQSTYTLTDNKGGAPSIDDPTNQSTIKSKEVDGNKTPKAKV